MVCAAYADPKSNGTKTNAKAKNMRTDRVNNLKNLKIGGLKRVSVVNLTMRINIKVASMMKHIRSALPNSRKFWNAVVFIGSGNGPFMLMYFKAAVSPTIEQSMTPLKVMM
mmetsp:Transcript_36022/g.103608  ORF Transcript_36022/g.103608 Transcript_36022/m.103608 type:complete len:111 (-) Transcript_36022:2203-2535(-)